MRLLDFLLDYLNLLNLLLIKWLARSSKEPSSSYWLSSVVGGRLQAFSSLRHLALLWADSIFDNIFCLLFEEDRHAGGDKKRRERRRLLSYQFYKRLLQSLFECLIFLGLSRCLDHLDIKISLIDFGELFYCHLNQLSLLDQRIKSVVYLPFLFEHLNTSSISLLDPFL